MHDNEGDCCRRENMEGLTVNGFVELELLGRLLEELSDNIPT